MIGFSQIQEIRNRRRKGEMNKRKEEIQLVAAHRMTKEITQPRK